jgi:hypothetical protein
LNGVLIDAPGGSRLLYHAYEMQRALFAGASNMAAIGARMLSNPALPMGYFGVGPMMASALEVFAHLHEERGKPEFGIEAVEIEGTRCGSPTGPTPKWSPCRKAASTSTTTSIT